MTHNVGFTPQAAAELAALDRQMQGRVTRALNRLTQAPFAATNVAALAGGGYRLRVGDYRVLYRIEASLRTVNDHWGKTLLSHAVFLDSGVLNQ